jgi:c(7)-type cytochrome triheme protein
MKKSRVLLMLLASLCIANISVAADSDFSDGGGILYTQPLNAVIFRHKYHVDVKHITCDKCHSGLFEMEALEAQEKDDFTMKSLDEGKYCGACHNGKDAFASNAECARCHVRLTDWQGQVGYLKGKPAPYKMPVYNTSISFGQGEMKVRFNHEKHSSPLNCRDCHLKLFRIKKGSNSLTLADHNRQKSCFGCHDGKETFSWYSCNKCHKNWTEIAQIGQLKHKAVATKGSCYKCHTSDSEMKALVKPPLIQSEGEG